MRSVFWRWFIFVLVAMARLEAGAQTNGIFADFTTSLGDFSCELDYTNSPKAVANFVGLATGTRAWLELSTGEVRTNAFFDGLIFFRVSSNLVNQAGSPDNLNTGTPGYSFVDQFSPSLTFNKPWMLAMANSGPDSNGSQFFLTVVPYTPWNNVYAVFGHVVSGTNVVLAINHVPTDENDKPFTNVVIQHVTIRRVGDAAQAFDSNAHGLPIVTNIPLKLALSGGRVSLTYSNRLYADNRFYSASNITSWSQNFLGVELTAPSSNSVTVAMDAPQKFFRFAQIQYPASTFAPKNLLGKTLTLAFTSQPTATIVFNNSGGGTFKYAGAQGAVTTYTWSQDVYRAFLWPIEFNAYLPPEMTLQMDFTGAKAGTFSGTAYSPFPVEVSGTFSLSP